MEDAAESSPSSESTPLRLDVFVLELLREVVVVLRVARSDVTCCVDVEEVWSDECCGTVVVDVCCGIVVVDVRFGIVVVDVR